MKTQEEIAQECLVYAIEQVRVVYEEQFRLAQNGITLISCLDRASLITAKLRQEIRMMEDMLRVPNYKPSPY